MTNNRKSLKYSFLLLLTACIWGGGFVAQSLGMDFVGPFTFNTIRSFLGGFILIPVILIMDKLKGDKKTPWLDKNLLIGGLICGVLLFLATNSQQIGIKYTTVGKSGFITAFYIVLVPVFSLALKKKPSKFIWISVVLALIGLYLLCITEESSFAVSKGDLFLFACAVLFALQILAVDKYAPLTDCLKLSSLEFIVCGLLGIVFMINENPTSESVFAAWKALFYSGFISCGVAYTLQVVAQKEVKPSVASLIMSLESVFSVLFGFLVLGQHLSRNEIIGCAIMFAAVILAQIEPSKKQSKC